MKIKIIIEKHSDGHIAYPLCIKGIIVGEGESCEEALKDVTSAIEFHVETFGNDVFKDKIDVEEAFIAEALLS